MARSAQPETTGVRALLDDVARIVSPVYLVGGSVRDALLGQMPRDYDFATPLHPDEVEKAVRAHDLRAYTAGKRFGTIGFRLGGHEVEVTTFRTETYAIGSRKPSVAFVREITHDLSRRDFTINAIAQRSDGKLIDPFGGRADLRQKVIRAVGRPSDRFREDPLRMLRAARFAAQLGFSVDPETERRALTRSNRILEVSKERWVQELDKLLISPHSDIGLQVLARTRLLNFTLPELAIQVGWDQDSPYHDLPLWEHTIQTVQLMPPDITLRWAALFHDAGKPFTRVKNRRGYSNYVSHELVGAELAEKTGRYLHWPNERTAQIRYLVRHHLEPDSPLRAADTAAARVRSDKPSAS